MAGFQVLQQIVDVLERRFIVVSARKTDFDAHVADDLLCCALFRRIPAFAHEADAGDQPFIL